jgi:hypothetical protein
MEVSWDGRTMLMFTEGLKRMDAAMLGKRRLTKPTLGIDAETHVAAVVPIGTIIDIPITAPGSVRMIAVVLDARPVIMFLWDLKSRSEAVVES